jgi:hypothetical protein
MGKLRATKHRWTQNVELAVLLGSGERRREGDTVEYRLPAVDAKTR